MVRYGCTVCIMYQCNHLSIYVDVRIDTYIRTHTNICVVLPTNAYISFSGSCGSRCRSCARSRSRPPSCSLAFSRSRSVGSRSLMLSLSCSLAQSLSLSRSVSLLLSLSPFTYTQTRSARSLHVSFIASLFTLFLSLSV